MIYISLYNTLFVYTCLYIILVIITSVQYSKNIQNVQKEFNRKELKNALLIGWQAYRGDQMQRKNSPTEPRNQIQVKYEKNLPGL